jgi:hypothetical protein
VQASKQTPASTTTNKAIARTMNTPVRESPFKRDSKDKHEIDKQADRDYQA